jgi:hypothetical protein
MLYKNYIYYFSDDAVVKRMNTLRTAYQKNIHMQGPSGSSPKGKTARIRDIMRMCSFLYTHVKTVPSVSSYTGRTTARPLFIQVKNVKKMSFNMLMANSSNFLMYMS